MEGGMRQGREWNEIGERVEWDKEGGGKEQGERMEQDREEDGVGSMNYPYIISTLFVLVWVDDG